MKWILGATQDIAVNENQLKARIGYIRQVTGADVSDWQKFQVKNRQFFCCVSKDNIEAVFITAHNCDVVLLFTLPHIYQSKIIVVNTCIWEKFTDKRLLLHLNRYNSNVALYFAKQDLSMDLNHIFRQTTTLHNIGQFGFQSSLSERELFMNRRKGLKEALNLSFNRVSLILLVGE